MAALFLILFGMQEPAEGAVEAVPTPTWLNKFHGHVQIRQRMRWTGRDRDSDLYQYWSALWGDPQRDDVTAVVHARFAEDLDGRRRTTGFSAFDSIDDTYRRAAVGNLYTAYLEVRRPEAGVMARAGRQTLEELPEAIPMDGGSIRIAASPAFLLAAFGGVPVNWFESSPQGDAMLGGWMEWRPWALGAARVEFLHLRDENLFGRFQNDLVGATLEHREGPMFASARVTWLEGEERDATVRLGSFFEDIGLMMDVQARSLFERQGALSFPIDPTSTFLVEVEPYVEATARVSQTLSERFTLDVSMMRRRLEDTDRDSAFNRGFSRWEVQPRLHDWPAAGFAFSVFADLWKARGDDFWTLGMDAGWEIASSISISLGTSFALYEIDAFTGEERRRVRSVYGAARIKLGGDTRADARISVDRDDFDSFATLSFGVRREF
ncbi:MAG: hypothetical protein HY716_05865 [Planctomycetes bacterium]|nr:hypothetical protein [Planctomycetota bacterium]